MKIGEIQKKAKSMGISPARMKKIDLVRAIQQKEGYFACFQTGKLDCAQSDCSWRSDCIPQGKSN
ncbi:MAG: SAP domain-containing protein [Deltaproteobacteria bacterium]